MVSAVNKMKVRSIMKTLLLCNKGKRFTAGEIVNFVNCNPFSMQKHSVTTQELSTYWRVDQGSNSSLLYDVSREKKGNSFVYWIGE